MGVLAGVAFVDIVPNMKNFGKNLTKGVTDAQKEQAGKIGKVGGLMFGAITAGAGLALHRAASLQQETQALKQTLHSAAAQVIKDSKNQKDSISQIDYLAYAKNAASYATAAGQTHEKAAKFAEQQIRLAQDLGALHGTSTADALAAIQAALSGSTTGLKRYDLVITQQGIKQQAVADGLVKTKVNAVAVQKAELGVTVAMKKQQEVLKHHSKTSLEARLATNNLKSAEQAHARAVRGTIPQLNGQQVILATQSYILHHANGALGAYSKLQGTTSNQVKRATANFTDLTANLGKQLLPYYTQLVGVLITVVGWMGKHQTVVKLLVGVVGALAAEMVVYSSAVKVATAVQAVYNTIWGETDAVMAANPIGLVVVALAALAAGLIYAYTHSKTFRNIVNAAFNAVKRVVGVVTNFIRQHWRILIALIPGIGPALFVVVNHFNQIKSVAVHVVSAIKTAWNTAVSFFSNLPSRISGAVSGLWGGIWQSFRSTINQVISAWNGLSFSIPGVHIPGIGSVGGATIGTPDIPLLATGGVLSPGQLGIVGERGPEFAMGGRGGTSIIPGNRLHMTITNWETGEGYIESIANGAIGRHSRHTNQKARMNRP